MAAKKQNYPVILGTSEGESGFFGLEEAVALVKIFKKKYNVSAFLHLDHGKDIDIIKNAIKVGYDSVHFDGSSLPIEENLKKTKYVVALAHKKGILAEGEIGYLRGSSKIHNKHIVIKKEDLTNPESAALFVKETKADLLAIAIGNVHGLSKKSPNLDLERLRKIKTKAFLVLHGGSGISGHDIKKTIINGITKININTELRIAWRTALLQSLKKQQEQIKPYKILPMAISAVQQKVEEKIKLFK